MEPDEKILTPQEIAEAYARERRWLRENDATSAVTGGPVEDQEGVPLPADLHQGRPPAQSEGEVLPGGKIVVPERERR